jgi:hypothetical protein
VNDVLLAVIAGGLRGLLRNRGEPIDGVTLPIYVPVSLRRGQSGQEGGNLISQMVAHLPLGVADPGWRLRQIAHETAKRKAISRPPKCRVSCLSGSRRPGTHLTAFSSVTYDPVSPLVGPGTHPERRQPQRNLGDTTQTHVPQTPPRADARSSFGRVNVVALIWAADYLALLRRREADRGIPASEPHRERVPERRAGLRRVNVMAVGDADAYPASTSSLPVCATTAHTDQMTAPRPLDARPEQPSACPT